ncbi:GNAT family N-acetyltransferase [Roseovarius aestuarii]|uniref:N-acyltransferase YncA n=1 Tax=Roseovarius aestuarii TaxID=475083 RepID=A0A1X7BSF7_9RHOB|nr:GNAT family N-acetyltransferase [Roseovarius aestuarii]SMC12571.1 N-acyltransferase YncA [Roseovarius aestuarii]
MIIRDARAADAPEIAAYWNPLIRETSITFNTKERDPDQLAQEIGARQKEGKAYLVVCEGSEVCGHATYTQFRAGPGYARCMEHTIILTPAVQGQGAGRLLMHALEDHARQRGVHSLIACISGENTGAIAFHAHLGFRQVASIPETGYKFGRWMDLIFMQKLL